MPKGYKTCSSCGASVGLRSKVCSKCQTPFRFKAAVSESNVDSIQRSTDATSSCPFGCDPPADTTEVQRPIAGLGATPGTLNDGTPAVVVTPTKDWLCPIRPWADDYDSIVEWVKMVFRWTKDNGLEYHENAVLYLVNRWWGSSSPSYNRVRGIVHGVLQSLPGGK